MVVSWAPSHDRGATAVPRPRPGGEEDGMEDKWLLVVLVIAILVGASRLPSLGRNLGQGIREFKRGIADATRDDAARDETKEDGARDDAARDQAGAEPAGGSGATPADDHQANPPASRR
jgi:sec-independent protein translocase protein TatA